MVGVQDESLKSNDRVDGGNETSVTQPHRVQPLHSLLLQEGNPSTLHQEQGDQGITCGLDRKGIVVL